MICVMDWLYTEIIFRGTPSEVIDFLKEVSGQRFRVVTEETAESYLKKNLSQEITNGV